MQVGERSEFHISSSYGYAEAGDLSKDSSDDIPPNADLIFEIELISASLSGASRSDITISEDLARLQLIREERLVAETKKKQLEEEKKKKKEMAQAKMAEKMKNKHKKGKGKKKK